MHINEGGIFLQKVRQFSILRLRIFIQVLGAIGIIPYLTVTSFAQSVTTGKVVGSAAESGAAIHAFLDLSLIHI